MSKKNQPCPLPMAVLSTAGLTVPAEVCRRLKLALVACVDAGETWKSLAARTLISDTNLIKMVRGTRYMGPAVAVRLAQALGFELQMKVVARRKKAA